MAPALWYKTEVIPIPKTSDKQVMQIQKDIELRVGRRADDGIIRISALPPQLIQLSVSYKGERSSSVVLTRLQIQALRQALAEYELAMDSHDGQSEAWDQNERRAG